MKLQDQVITLDQAKRLKGFGVCQVSQCIWRDGHLEHIESVNSWSDQETVKEMLSKYDAVWEKSWRDDWQIYSAFTVAELGVMIGKGTNAAAVLYDAVQGQMNRSHSFTIALSAQFVANCLIGMLETGFLAADEVNARLCADK